MGRRVSYRIHHTRLTPELPLLAQQLWSAKDTWARLVSLVATEGCEPCFWWQEQQSQKQHGAAGIVAHCMRGNKLTCLGPKPPESDVSGSRARHSLEQSPDGASLRSSRIRPQHVGPGPWAWTVGADLLGKHGCGQWKIKCVFLQNFHLRIFTFNIFLKQFKEQKKVCVF